MLTTTASATTNPALPSVTGSAATAPTGHAVSARLTGWPGLLFVVAVGGWFGAMLFFSAIATPQVFGVLGTEQGGPVVAAMFPRYYILGTLCSLAGAAALWLVRGRTSTRTPVLAAACLIVGAALLLVSWLVVEPQVAAAKGGVRGTLHLLSIGLNGVDMLLTAAALGLATLRR